MEVFEGRKGKGEILQLKYSLKNKQQSKLKIMYLTVLPQEFTKKMCDGLQRSS